MMFTFGQDWSNSLKTDILYRWQVSLASIIYFFHSSACLECERFVRISKIELALNIDLRDKMILDKKNIKSFCL